MQVVVPPAAVADDHTVSIFVVNTTGMNGAPYPTYQYRAVHALKITSVLPNRGGIAGGEWPSIFGSGFLATTAVKVGGKPANFIVNSDYQITIQTPPMDVPFLYNVSVETASEVTPSTPASHYLYLGRPELRGMDHHLGLTSGGEQLTITGDQLIGVTGVDFGSIPVSFEVASNNSIITMVPACAAGTVVVTLHSTRGDSALTLGSLFTYRTPGTPLVTQVDANRGSTAGGETVVIHGSGFTGVASVRFGDTTPAVSFTIDSDEQITAIAPRRSVPALVNVFVDTSSGSNPNGPASWYLYR